MRNDVLSGRLLAPYDLPITEPIPIQDDFVEGVVRLDAVGTSNFRVTFYACHTEPGGDICRVIIRKLVMPCDARPAIRAAFSAFFETRARLIN